MSYFYGLKRMIKSKIFWLAVTLNILFIFFNSDFLLCLEWPFVDLMNQIQDAYGPGMAAFVAPVVTALPYVTQFHEERDSGSYRMKVIRQGKLSYVVHHMVLGMLSGFSVMIFSLAIYSFGVWGVSFVLHKPVVFRGIVGAFGDGNNPGFYYRLMIQGLAPVVYVFHCLFLGFYGMVWSGIGVAISVFIKNRNFARIVPLFIKRLMEYFLEQFYIVTPNYFRFEGIYVLPAAGSIYAISYLVSVFVLGAFCMLFGLNRLLKRQG